VFIPSLAGSVVHLALETVAKAHYEFTYRNRTHSKPASIALKNAGAPSSSNLVGAFECHVLSLAQEPGNPSSGNQAG
jgi:hypothetical protein